MPYMFELRCTLPAPPREVYETWLSSEGHSQMTGAAADSDEDSLIEVTLAPAPEGALLTLRHSHVPDGQTSYERGGWRDFYFEPMRAYFQARRDAAHG